jgi:CoA:oxalate CoA-transferase
MSSHPQPLAGIRVLDLTRVLAGPFCTMILADLGAEVVKVERPGTGDDARQFGPFLLSGLSAYFASINRGKKSITLNLKNETDRETFLKLVAVADVLVENFRPGTLDALGLAATELRQINPSLVFASLTGFGQTGPLADRPAYDIVVQALSGLMSITGNGPGQCVRVGTSISDLLTGMYGAIAVISAVRHRERTGEGCTIDLSMLDCAVSALENAISRFSVTGEVPQPLGTRHPSITPFQGFATADGSIVIAAGNDSLWRRLCEVIGRPELADHPLLKTNAARTTNQTHLEECVARVLRAKTTAEWLSLLCEAGIPAAPIRGIGEVVADEHVAARGLLHEMRDAAGEKFLTAGSPLRMNDCAPALSPRAPELGEHSESVNSDWLGREVNKAKSEG